jgi:hypothetical protein
MSDNRLDLIDPGLSAILQHLSARQLRHITYTICNLALERTGVRDPVIDEAMKALKIGQYDSVSLHERLGLLVERLDQNQWDVQDAVDAGQADEGAYICAFAQARAAHAVYFALYADPFTAATEAIYEAQAAMNDRDSIKAVISTSG